MVKQTDELKDFEVKNKLKIKIIHVDRNKNKIMLYNCGGSDKFIEELHNIIETKVLK